jgi:hypothetical protein
MKFAKRVTPWLLLTILGVLLLGPADLFGGPLPGAIFTTNVNGTRVNQNKFDNKCDVYLDGGPGPNAPQGAAGLPDGDYYFQVTDPSGKTLLSTDPVMNRQIHVSAGIITGLSGAGNHGLGNDTDHPPARTIQLCDYLDTPNPGGVYKAWVTPIGDFVGDPTKVDSNCGHGCFHGFVPSASKVDNFKVKGGSQPGGACLVLNKVLNLVWVAGWPITIYDPSGAIVQGPIFSYLTKDCIAFNLQPGTYLIVEELQGSTVVSVRVDGVYLSNPDDTVVLKIKNGDTGSHEIIYYNSK